MEVGSPGGRVIQSKARWLLRPWTPELERCAQYSLALVR